MSLIADPRIGTELAGYRIESLLGRGGMGVVYLAEDVRLKRRVALKLVVPALDADPRFRERFLREAEQAASLDHSHVVPVHAAGETDGQLWIAMRYVQGTDLRTLLEREGPLEPARALELVGQVASALDAAHAHGLVHRDVKPANVLVTDEDGKDHCYLSDFGLARSADAGADPATTPHLSGTVDYTAPEQIAREPADHRADGYSLGCVLYECLAGEPPFKRPRQIATLFAHSSEPPPSLHEQRPELPDAIDEVIQRALSKEPVERYGSCGELCEAMKKALGLEQARWSRRAVLLTGGGAVLGLAAAVAAPALLLTRRDSGQAERAGRVPLPLQADSLVRIDPATIALAAATKIGAGPTQVAVGEGAVWVINSQDKTLVQIDPATSRVAKTIDLGSAGTPDSLAVGEGAVWTAYFTSSPIGRLIRRYDPRSGSLTSVGRRLSPASIAVGEGTLWVDDFVSGHVLRIDPATGDVIAEIPASGTVRFGQGSAWIAGSSSPYGPPAIVRIDPSTNDVVATIALDSMFESSNELFTTESGVAVGEGAVWLIDPQDDSVVRIDAATNTVAGQIRVGRSPAAVAVGQGAAWVANSRDGTVTRIDPLTLDVTTIQVGGTPTDVAVGDKAVWVTVDVR